MPRPPFPRSYRRGRCRAAVTLPLVFWRFFILKIRLVVLAAVIDADDIHGVVRYLKQNCHTPTKPKRSQARSKIVAPRASVREGLQLLAMVHDGIDIARRHCGRRCPGNIDFQLVELVASFRGEMNGVRHAEADRLRLSARCSRTWSTLSARLGSAFSLS